MPENEVQVRAARWPADLATAGDLLKSYFQWLAGNPSVPDNIRSIDRRSELGSLETRYDGDAASLLLAQAGVKVLGCAAVQQLAYREHAVEMKRLFVLPEAQGQGVGRALIEACADWARERGAQELLLDTIPAAMPSAMRLYRSLGFMPTPRYNENPVCLAFFRLAIG